MRQRYLVTYDVCDAKRLRKVFKLLKGFGDHVQLSVFRCDLAPIDLVRMKQELLAVIHSKEDQVLIIDVGPTMGRGAEVTESLGRAYVEPDHGPTIV